MFFESVTPLYCVSDDHWFRGMLVECGETYARRANSSSSEQAKLSAYSTIYEEIGHLRNKIRALETLISQCKASIIDWKRHQNTLSSCFKLPNEIHIEIWKYLARDARNLSTSWIRVAHVCSGWRRLALSTPSLWTWPCIRQPQIAAQMLKRAGNSKLALVLDQRTVSWLPTRSFVEITATKQLVSQIIPRACVLIADFSKYAEAANISGSTSYFASIMNAYARSANYYTNLEYIEITYPQFSPAHAQQTIDHQVLNFVQYSPNLKCLDLEGTSPFIPRGETVFSRNVQDGLRPASIMSSPRSITTLRVYFNLQNAQMVSIQQILKTMRHLPHLTTLTLANIFAVLSDEDIGWCDALPQPILFEQLKNILISGGTQALSVVLGSISYHPQSTVRVLGWRHLDRPQDASGCLSHDQAAERMIQTATHRMAPLINYAQLLPWRTVGRWRLVFSHRVRVSGREYDLTLVDLFVDAELELLLRMIPTLPLNSLLELDYRLPYSDLTTWKFFGALRKLEHISITLHMHPTFLRTLALCYGSDSTIFDCHCSSLDLEKPSIHQAHDNLLFYFPLLRTLTDLSSVPLVETFPLKEEYIRIRNARRSWGAGCLEDRRYAGY